MPTPADPGGARARCLGLVAAVLLGMMLWLPAALANQLDWNDLAILNGGVEGDDLVIDVAGPGTYPLFVLDDPGVGPPRFSLETTAGHDRVEDSAYLEMWVVLDDGSRYFSRTLAETGPMAVMRGTSDGRPITLPFELGDDGPVPASLEVNLVTSGAGTFRLAPFTVTGDDDARQGDDGDGGGWGWWILPVAGAGIAAGVSTTWIGRRRRMRETELRRIAAIDGVRATE